MKKTKKAIIIIIHMILFVFLAEYFIGASAQAEEAATEQGTSTEQETEPVAPQLTVEFDKDWDNQVEKDGVQYCYSKEERKGTFVVTDESVEALTQYPKLTVFYKAENGQIEENILSEAEWTLEEKKMSATISFDKEGEYRIQMEYTSPGGTKLEPGEAYIIVIDKTKPVIDVMLSGKSADVNQNQAYISPVHLKLCVKDKSFHPEGLEYSGNVSYYDEEGKKKENTLKLHLEEQPWVSEEDGWVKEIDFKEDYIYDIQFRYKDYANHRSSQRIRFVLDQEGPKISVKEITGEGLRKEQYKDFAYISRKPVEVTVEAVDRISGVQAVVYELKSEKINSKEDILENSKDSKRFEETIKLQVGFEGTIRLKSYDQFGNKSETIETEGILIDAKKPDIQVLWGDHNPQEGFYYNETRRARIVITESHYFSDGIQWKLTGDESSIGIWSHEGDKHYCEVTFDKDGIYQLGIKVVDYAGNGDKYESEEFVIDKTAPTCEIRGVENLSTNNGIVRPEVVYHDANLDKEDIKITLTGAKNGQVEYEHYQDFDSNKGHIECWKDFPYKKNYDDIYTLTVYLKDKAGNETSKTCIFSVNRFGSTYKLASGTEDLVKEYYTNANPTIKITEVNVNLLKEKEIYIKKDGQTLEKLSEGKDYRIKRKTTLYGWQQYEYIIFKKVFDADGRYSVTLYSTDEAGNQMNNLIDGAEVEFIVDKTEPAAAIMGIEEYQYKEEKHKITLHIWDNFDVKEAVLYVNGDRYQTFYKEDLDNPEQKYTVTLYSMEEEQKISLKVYDEAGNEYTTKEAACYISKLEQKTTIKKAETAKESMKEPTKEQIKEEDISIDNQEEELEESDDNSIEIPAVITAVVIFLMVLLLALVVVFS